MLSINRHCNLNNVIKLLKMRDLEDFQEDLLLFESFEDSLKSKDYNKARECLKLIRPAEEAFLNNYSRRKTEGVYYTSREISRFIVSQALILFLNKKLEEDKHIDFKFETLEEMFKSNQEIRQKISNILINTTICDPACGSGVFLYIAADTIFNVIKKINPQMKDVDAKAVIIKNINGFDINEHSVKLSILKLVSWMDPIENNDFVKLFSFLKLKILIENSLFMKNTPKFDIIVGNPPYGNILTKNEKELLKKEDIFHNDIYCAFLLKLVYWSDGVLSLLVPKSFLVRQGYIKFRKKFLSKVNILRIFDIGPNLFKKATNEVQIVIYEKKSGTNKNVKIFDYPNNEIITYPDQKFDSLRICYNLKCPMCENSKKIYAYTPLSKCPYCNAETLELNRIRIKPPREKYRLIEKIERIGDLNYLNVRNFPRMVRGEEDKGLKEVKRILRDNLRGTCYFINAKEDFKYYYIKKNKSFNIEEIEDKVLKGKNYEYYTSPKLLIKHNNIIPEAIFTKESVCFTSSIYSLLHDDINELKYLCAVLNSSLIKFYCTYGINNQKGTTINLNQYMIRHLPIIKPDEQVRNEIVIRVDKIIHALQERKGVVNDSINQMIEEIDGIIFDLYLITKEESLIIYD